MKLNEDFTNLYKRWRGGEVRKEDKIDESLVYKFMYDYDISEKDVRIHETDVDFSCDINITRIEELTFKIDKVIGDFNAYAINIKDGDMKYFPEYVSGDFDISRNSLTSLEGCPKEVIGSFYASNSDNLKSLEYLPKHIGGNLLITGTNFTEDDIPSDCKIDGVIKFKIRRR